MCKRCKGSCDLMSTKRPFGNPYVTHVYCRVCSVWLKKEIGSKCPCCNTLTRSSSRKRKLSKLIQ